MKTAIFYLLNLAVRWADRRTDRLLLSEGNTQRFRDAGRLELRLVRWRSKFR